MDSREAARHTMRETGTPAAGLSRALGKHPNYVQNALSTHNDMQTMNFAAMAEAMGYKVHVTGHDEDISISPEEDA